MNAAFEIIKLTPALAKKYAASPSRPHRHDYEELIIISKGSPQHFIDFQQETIVAPLVIYVAQGKIHQFLPTIETEGWAIRYKSEFIPQSRFNFYSNFADNINYPIAENDCLQKFNTICELMLDETKQEQPEQPVIKHLLQALLAKIEAEGRNILQKTKRTNNLQLLTFNNFLKVVEANYKRPEGVQFYADKLNMSVRNLNMICQQIFNKSISEIVETRKLIEARNLLLTTELSVSEIGYELGYNEKAYFTRVFHKRTGLPPSEYRKTAQV